MKTMAICLSLIFSTAATAGNYATCIIDKAQGVQNDAAAFAAVSVCQSQYPGSIQAVKQGEGRGWFSYDSGAECIADKAAKTPNQRAGYIIAAACRKLYDPPEIPWWTESPPAPTPPPAPVAQPAATPQLPQPVDQAAALPRPVQRVAVEPIQSRPGKLPQEAPCVIKRVMTDEEIRWCRN